MKSFFVNEIFVYKKGNGVNATTVIKAGESGYFACEMDITSGTTGVFAVTPTLKVTYSDDTTFLYEAGINNQIASGASYALPSEALKGTVCIPFTAAKNVKSVDISFIAYAATGTAAAVKFRVRALTICKS